LPAKNKRLDLKSIESFEIASDKVFTIEDANVFVTDNNTLNSKLKTSFTFEFDKSIGQSSGAAADGSQQKLIQVLKD
jgi:hypothetical protein